MSAISLLQETETERKKPLIHLQTKLLIRSPLLLQKYTLISAAEGLQPMTIFFSLFITLMYILKYVSLRNSKEQ